MEERNKEEKNRITKASTLMSWLRKMWTAPTCTQSRVQNEEEETPSTGPNMNPGNAEVVDIETSSEVEEGGEKHKAPDEKRRPVKTINDMESVARDKEGEVFGPETADIKRGGEKLEPAVEGSNKTNTIHVKTTHRGTLSGVQNGEEENPRKVPDMNSGDAEVVDTETSSELEEGGEKHKAPDERRRPVKTINDVESVARDKEGEVFGPKTADIKRGGKKLELAVEGRYKTNTTHVETTHRGTLSGVQN